MTVQELLVYQELLYRIQILETCQSLCKTAPVSTDMKELLGHYQLVDAVLHCAAKERKTAGENLEKITVDCRKRFSSFHASTPDQYRQSVSALFGTVLPAWLQWRNTYVPIGEEAKQK